MEPITGLELVETGCEATPRTIPVVLSCSLDGSIRMFNFETSQCVYRFDVQHEILGIGFIKKDIFYHYSKQCVYIWTMNRFHYTFSFLRCVQVVFVHLSLSYLVCNIDRNPLC